MSLAATQWVIYDTPKDLDPACFRILIIMADRVGPEGDGFFESVTTLASYAGCSERTVRSKLRMLEDLKLIRLGDQRLTKYLGNRRPRVYDLCMLNQGSTSRKQVGKIVDDDDVVDGAIGFTPPKNRGAKSASLEKRDVLAVFTESSPAEETDLYEDSALCTIQGGNRGEIGGQQGGNMVAANTVNTINTIKRENARASDVIFQGSSPPIEIDVGVDDVDHLLHDFYDLLDEAHLHRDTHVSVISERNAASRCIARNSSLPVSSMVAALRWALLLSDGFWRANLLSMAQVSKHFESVYRQFDAQHYQAAPQARAPVISHTSVSSVLHEHTAQCEHVQKVLDSSTILLKCFPNRSQRHARDGDIARLLTYADSHTAAQGYAQIQVIQQLLNHPDQSLDRILSERRVL